MQAPVKDGVKDVKELAGKRIVTSFPRLCKKFFDQHDSPDNPTSKPVSTSPTYFYDIFQDMAQVLNFSMYACIYL